jgi:hypothetical protein
VKRNRPAKCRAPKPQHRVLRVVLRINRALRASHDAGITVTQLGLVVWHRLTVIPRIDFEEVSVAMSRANFHVHPVREVVVDLVEVAREAEKQFAKLTFLLFWLRQRHVGGGEQLAQMSSADHGHHQPIHLIAGVGEERVILEKSF